MHEAYACDENGGAGLASYRPRLSQKLEHGVAWGRRLTCKPAFFLFPPGWGRERGAQGLVVRRQSDVA